MTTEHAIASLALALALGGCANAPECPPAAEPVAPTPELHGAARAAPASIAIFIRHAEKAADAGADPPLTDRGQRRADCLATLLTPFEPDRLLTSEYQRTRDTLAPLARATGLTPAVIDAADLAGWTTALRELPPGSRVVIAGHSNTIPAWVATLGVQLEGLDADGNIGHDEYDRLIEVVLDEHGHAITSATFAQCVEPAP